MVKIWPLSGSSDFRSSNQKDFPVLVFLLVVLALISTCTAVFAWYWIWDPETSKVHVPSITIVFFVTLFSSAAPILKNRID